MKELTLDDAITLGQLFNDRSKSNNSSLNMDNIQYLLKSLYINNHNNLVRKGDIIISFQAGFYGNLVIRTVDFIDAPMLLTAKGNNYNYITISTNNEHTILWTDFSTIQPFDRQNPFYVPFSFECLNLTKKENYNEYQCKRSSNISFPVWGFSYNEYWKIVRMGMCISTDKLDNVISELRRILNKPE